MKNLQNFLKALSIISNYHTIEVIINKPVNGSIGNLTSGKPTIHLKNANAGCIEALQSENFVLSLDNGLISINDYKL